MKKTLVIIAHPDINNSTINKQWAEAITGYASIRHLYNIYPKGASINVEEEQAILEQHDRIIFQFPLYWYAAPALLKQWIDEVFTEGWAYGSNGNKMEGKEIGVAVSCGGQREQFATGGIQRHPINEYMSVFDGICGFIRANYIGVHTFFDTYNPLALEQLSANCNSYIQFIQK